MSTKYGTFRAKCDEFDFTFTPSFRAMSALCDARDIMEIFSDLFLISVTDYVQSFENHNFEIFTQIKKVTGKKQLKAAHEVLTACCDVDCSDMIGTFRRGKTDLYWKGAEEIPVLITLAQHLLKHGMVGVTKDRVAKKRSKSSSEYDPMDFVELAQLRLHRTKSEALDMTMTEFLAHWLKEHPPTDEEKFACTTEEEAEDFYRKAEETRRKIEAKKGAK